jgi:3-oxoacyl-[acyl-carrier-protein] synthase-3
MTAYVKAISYYLPNQLVTNEDLAKAFPEYTVEKIATKIGVSERHIAGENITSADLAFRAALKLFEEYGIVPSSIDFILFCTQSPDYFLPTSAC